MKHHALALLSLLATAVMACGSSGTSPSGGGGGGAGGAGNPTADVRGQRYCEILLGTVSGSAIHVDVYTTEGLNECPEAAWSALDTTALQAATMSSFVQLNGPRYWTIDSLTGSSLLDPTPRTLGGIDMRKAGAIDLVASDLAGLGKPYTQHTIQRHSEFSFLVGKSVYELTDPAGHVYEMQSYSVQDTPQTEASLADLGSKLALPQGWSFQTRVLDADLVLTATTGTATVVQDDLLNTYLMSK